MFQVIGMPARTLAWWLDQRDDVDFEPVYQRKSRVWSPSSEQFLIDSIINGFDIPKIYIADFTFMNTVLNRAKKKYAIIDGKQRLEAIFRFYDGKFVLADDFEYQEEPSLKLGGLSYKDLVLNHPKIARKFENHNLTIMSVITDDEAKINELFVRLNSSRPLTGAELRNAMPGSVPEIVRQLVLHPFFVSKVRFSKLRSQDKNLAAKLLLIEHRGQLVDTKKSQLDDLVEEHSDRLTNEVVTTALSEANEQVEEALVNSEGGSIELSAERVRKVLDRMCGVFVDSDALLASQAAIVPYYWLARELESPRLPELRAFLVDFEAALRDNRLRSVDDPAYDPELANYYTMSRTSNDAASMRGRYRILRGRLDGQA